MNTDSIKQRFDTSLENLMMLARKHTFNEYSNNMKFIMTEIKNSEENFHQQRVLNNQLFKTQIPFDYEFALEKVQKIYKDVYDFNLYIYKSSESETIINIRYYSKSSLETDFRKTVIGNLPMFHSKISLPNNYIENIKFDINWELEFI